MVDSLILSKIQKVMTKRPLFILFCLRLSAIFAIIKRGETYNFLWGKQLCKNGERLIVLCRIAAHGIATQWGVAPFS